MKHNAHQSETHTHTPMHISKIKLMISNRVINMEIRFLPGEMWKQTRAMFAEKAFSEHHRVTAAT